MPTLNETEKFVPTKPGSSLNRGDPKRVDETEHIRLLYTSPVTLKLFLSDWREGAGSTPLEQEQSLRWLTKLYTFKDYVQVANFLRENPFLIDLLVMAYMRIQRYFSFDADDVEVALEVFTDPEAEYSQQLFALIHTSLPPEEEADLLENLYDEWWLDTLPAARGKLIVSAE